MNPLRTYLSAAGVTQVRFAEMIGVQQSMVSRLLNGSARPSLETAVAIERITGGAVPAATWVPATGGVVTADESSGSEGDATARSAFTESARGNAGIAPAPETGEDAAASAGAARDASPGAAPSGPAEPAAGMQAPAAGVASEDAA